MNKQLISLLLIAFFIGSCVPALASPTQLPPATATQTVIPSETPSPTQTSIPTATSYPSLQTYGPYLLYSNGYNSLTMMDANGIGRKQIELPIGGYLGWHIDNTVSPDGKWLAYYTGSEKEPYDLALHLLNLADGTTQFISQLIAPGFPENLEPVTKTILTEYDKECSNDPKCKLRIVQTAFQEGIGHGQAIDWSPDGRFLAFAAQIDGPSSDIYIFDTAENSIRRLTDEPENIWSNDWSLNGKKILYLDSVPTGRIYLSRNIRIANPKAQSIQHPKEIDGGAFWYNYGWVGENLYLTYYGGEGAPPNHLRIINTETQQVKEIWKYSAESFFVDLKRKKIILSPYGRIYLRQEPETGIYTVSFDGTHQKVSNEIVYFIDGQDAVNEYIAITQQNQLVGVKLDGSITPLSRAPDYYVPPRSSPDGKWIIITSETGTELYSEGLQLIKSLGIHATEIIWRPDSTGVFLYSDPNLYYLSVDNIDKLSEVCVEEDCWPYRYVWLP